MTGEIITANPDLKVTELTEFKKWAGNDVLKDASGKPQIFWHTTSADLFLEENFEFAPTKFEGVEPEPSYFSTDRDYTVNLKAHPYKPSRVYPFFLRARKVADFRELGVNQLSYKSIAKYFYGKYGVSLLPQELDELAPFWYHFRISHQNLSRTGKYKKGIINSLLNHGFDAVRYMENIDRYSTDLQKNPIAYETCAVFNSNQIKLADGTNKTFDSSDSDVRFSSGGTMKSGTIASNSSLNKLPPFAKPLKVKDLNQIGLYRNIRNPTEEVARFLLQHGFILNHVEIPTVYMNGYSLENLLYYNHNGKNSYRNVFIYGVRKEVVDALMPDLELKETYPYRKVYAMKVTKELGGDFDALELFKRGGNVLIAPNGKISNLTPEQYKLVRTKAFKAWFGDWEKEPENSSKVVDENGEPAVMYHKSKQRFFFREFKVDRELGSHFGTKAGVDFLSNWRHGYLYKVFLNIRNPIRLTDKGHFTGSQLGDAMAEHFEDEESKVIAQQIHDTESRAITSPFENPAADAIHMAKHYAAKKEVDGVVYMNRFESFNLQKIAENKKDATFIDDLVSQDISDNDFKKSVKEESGISEDSWEDSWIAFYPNQIKLADGSNHTFDSNSPDIEKALGGNIEEFGYGGFTANVVDNPKELMQLFPPVHPNHFYHHATIWLAPESITHIKQGDKVTLKAVGRVTTPKVDVLLIEGMKSKNKYPHITLSTAEGVRAGMSNPEIERVINTPSDSDEREVFDTPVLIEATQTYIESRYKAPNGKPTQLHPELYQLVRTPEFIAWFGDWLKAYETKDYSGVSKVIDENGEPMVVWHGTPTKSSESNNRYVREEGDDTPYPVFWTFREDSYGITDSGWAGRGIYFTPDKDYAFEFGDRLIPCFARMLKPFALYDDNTNSIGNHYRFLQSIQHLVGLPEKFKLNYTLPASQIREDWQSGEKVTDTFHVEEYYDDKLNRKMYWILRDYGDKPDWGGSIELITDSPELGIAYWNDKEIRKIEYGGFLLHTIKEIGTMAFKELLTNNGYDGVLQFSVERYRPPREQDTHWQYFFTSIISIEPIPSEVVVYRSNQVKLADGTNKTFDATNPDIRFGEGGATESENFKKWFKNSRVVDEKGKPKVMYHGTKRDFPAFEKQSGVANTDHPSRHLGFFFADKKIAQRFLTPSWFIREDEGSMKSEYFAARKRHLGIDNYSFAADAQLEKEWIDIVKQNKGLSRDIGFGANIIPAYLSIQNPHQMTFDQILGMSFIDDGGAIKMREDLISKGYDGIEILPNKKYPEAKYTQYVAFYPSQIKSAIGNIGTFDADNPDIRLGRGGKLTKQEKADMEHAKALEQTGFWGKQGAGCIFLCPITSRIGIQLRSENVEQPNTWGTSGGAVDKGLTPAKAAIKEVKDELGVELKTNQLIKLDVFHKDKFKYTTFLALVRKEFRVRPNNDEISDFRWFELDRLPENLHFGLAATLAKPEVISKIKSLFLDIDIDKIILDLKDTCISLKEYIEKNRPSLVDDEEEIYEMIVRKQEIGLCDSCNCWFELGELNEQSECEGCNSME